jgi:hypothetical protein
VSSRSGDELIELLLTEEMDPEEEGETANDLLAEVIRGYPALNLSRLIHSDNRRAVEAGAFVVSELGAKAAQVIDEIDFLLSAQSRNARFDAIDATLAAASSEHGAIIAKAVMLVVDSDQAVRWKALRFLAKATPDQLAAAAPHLADRHMADLVAWLEAGGSDPAHLPDILNRLHDPDKRTRMFAAAAAARVAAADRQGLERAAASDDPEVRSFAESVLSELDLDKDILARQELRRRKREGAGG